MSLELILTLMSDNIGMTFIKKFIVKKSLGFFTYPDKSSPIFMMAASIKNIEGLNGVTFNT